MTPSKQHTCTAAMALTIAAMALLTMSACQSTDNAWHGYQMTDHDMTFNSAADRPPTPRTLLAMAHLLAAQGKDKEAGFVLQRLIQEHPQTTAAYVALAEIHMRTGRIEHARWRCPPGWRRSRTSPS